MKYYQFKTTYLPLDVTNKILVYGFGCDSWKDDSWAY